MKGVRPPQVRLRREREVNFWGQGKLTGLVSSARETWFYGRVKRKTQKEKLTDEVWWARFGKPTKNLEPS